MINKQPWSSGANELLFVFKACVVPCVVCHGRVECIGVVVIMTDTGSHGPAARRSSAVHWCLGGDGGCSWPGAISSRPSSIAHGQVEGQVLWSCLLEGLLHHVLVVVLFVLDLRLPPVLEEQKDTRVKTLMTSVVANIEFKINFQVNGISE